MKTLLIELITLISSGCMQAEEIEQVAAEAAQAHADAAAFLAANPDINYDDSFPIPLWQWIVLGSLPDTVFFQADSYAELFGQVSASFGEQVAIHLKPKQLARTEPLAALTRIQTQLAALSKDLGGYVLVDFGERLDFELQMVLVYGHDVPRVVELCTQLGIAAAPSLQALRVALHTG
ncbi:hypothetical protein [Pseudomonas typographi]|uniref:Lipoprotein n=1 Tax=Pseudomonas typographi TaxID=2715964 RepID=A0ABR7Z3J2_9PSED|nr:hypothetical protein [Pseudomonas typographi]MBD1551984.1 hypothetical protein [Pseudomonas typographi]MBD1586548.1 hypothetical protein [Pseudomonas typographi]MBD1600049.1 hypothetical protein [Pseudomonas typographi]